MFQLSVNLMILNDSNALSEFVSSFNRNIFLITYNYIFSFQLPTRLVRVAFVVCLLILIFSQLTDSAQGKQAQRLDSKLVDILSSPLHELVWYCERKSSNNRLLSSLLTSILYYETQKNEKLWQYKLEIFLASHAQSEVCKAIVNFFHSQCQ